MAHFRIKSTGRNGFVKKTLCWPVLSFFSLHIMTKIGIRLRSSFFWDVTQFRLVVITDVPGQPIGAIFKGQEIQE